MNINLEPSSTEEQIQLAREELDEQHTEETIIKYSRALVTSPQRKRISEGISMLEELKQELPTRAAEAHYLLAFGYFRIEDVKKANEVIDEAERKKLVYPKLVQLKEIIQSYSKSEKIAIGTGVAVGVGIMSLLGVALFRGLRRK